MPNIRDDNFYTVLGWMLNVLHLKSNELIVFAIIYSFSQDGESEFKGSLSYLQEFANVGSQNTVLATLKSLEEKRYITKRKFQSGKVPRVAYSVNFEVIDYLKKDVCSLIPNNGE